jgi:hypothetical protein
MTTVFISYRRETASGEARALFNDLVDQLGKNSVFMDVDSIALGRDFRSILQKTLGTCDLMLVIIDKDWVTVKDEKGKIRLENPSDYVRLEVEAALKRDIVVTPVLVKGAQMPSPEQLPAEIGDLTYRNAFEITFNRWESDVREMMRRLGLDSPERGGGVSAHGRSTLSGEAPRKSVSARLVESKPRHVWFLVFALVVVALSIGLFLLHRYESGQLMDVHPSHQLAEHEPGDAGPRPGAAANFRVADYIGEWTNADPNTSGITRILVRKDNEKLGVEVFGRCHPTDCDWGTVEAKPFGANVQSSADAPINSVVATFSPGFAEKRLTLRLTTRDTLTSLVDTHFTDRSGRGDYETTEQLLRARTSSRIKN